MFTVIDNYNNQTIFQSKTYNESLHWAIQFAIKRIKSDIEKSPNPEYYEDYDIEQEPDFELLHTANITIEQTKG